MYGSLFLWLFGRVCGKEATIGFSRANIFVIIKDFILFYFYLFCYFLLRLCSQEPICCKFRRHICFLTLWILLPPSLKNVIVGLAQVTRIDVKTLTGIKIVLVDRERRKVAEIVVREGQRGTGGEGLF